MTMLLVENRCDNAFHEHALVETCSVAYRGLVEYALEESDSLNDFLAKDRQCAQANDERACLDISLENNDDGTPGTSKE